MHLAIFRDPFLEMILVGTKTIESRFAVRRSVPWRRVHANETLLLKEPAGPVVGAVRIAAASFHERPNDGWGSLRDAHAEAIGATSDAFWDARAAKRFATLVEVAEPVRLEPFAVDKRDRRPWVVLSR